FTDAGVATRRPFGRTTIRKGLEVVRRSVELEGWSSAPGAAVRQARSVKSRFRNGRTTTDEIITHGQFDVAAAARVRAGGSGGPADRWAPRRVGCPPFGVVRRADARGADGGVGRDRFGCAGRVVGTGRDGGRGSEAQAGRCACRR